MSTTISRTGITGRVSAIFLRSIRPCGVAWIAVAGLVLIGACARFEKKKEATPPPPPEVLVVDVGSRDVQISSEWIGAVDGFVNATVRAKVQGYVLRQAYADGATVKAGDLLFEIDPRPFQASLDQAKGELATAEGQLGQAEAALGKADIDVRRYTPLAATGAISQQDLDDAVQAQFAARAAVAAAKATIDSAKANVENAQINLAFTKVTSPVDGVASIATTQVGDLVGPGTGVLTTVSTLDRVKVNFPISEQEFLRASDKFATQIGERGKDVLELILADGSVYPHRGSLSAANRQVDTRTGTIIIVGVFSNPGNVLRPGQYAKIRAVTKTLPGAVVVPQRAISEVQGSFQVMVVGEDDKAEVRQVELGPQVSAAEVVVAKGLEDGELLVVDGFQKVRPGTKVTTKPWNPSPPPKSRRRAPAASPDASEGDAPASGGKGDAGSAG